MVVFGTTYSDAGLPNGIWSYNNRTDPPEGMGYFEGRCSNGPVWSEVLSTAREFPLISFAVSGATVNDNATTGAPTTLAGELDAFAEWLQTGNNSLPDGPTMAAIEFGTSDLIALANNPDLVVGDQAVEAYLSNISKGIKKAAIELIEVYNFTNILLFTLPPLAQAPMFQNMTDAELQSFNRVVTSINSDILDVVSSIKSIYNQTNGHNVFMLELSYWISLVDARPSAYGFKNVSSPCLLPTAGPNNTVDICNRPADYFYWDGLSPSLVGHRFLAKLLLPMLRAVDLVW